MKLPFYHWQLSFVVLFRFKMRICNSCMSSFQTRPHSLCPCHVHTCPCLISHSILVAVPMQIAPRALSLSRGCRYHLLLLWPSPPPPSSITATTTISTFLMLTVFQRLHQALYRHHNIHTAALWNKILLFPFYRWRKWGRQKLSNLPQVILWAVQSGFSGNLSIAGKSTGISCSLIQIAGWDGCYYRDAESGGVVVERKSFKKGTGG